MPSFHPFPGVAVITGAASGIGRQCAIAFAAEGCTRIALLDRDEEGMSETSRLCKEKARAVFSPNGAHQFAPVSPGSSAGNSLVRTFIIPCDFSVESEVSVSLDCVVEEWGRIDYAVNCAGILGPSGPSHRAPVDGFDRVMAVNCRGVWLSARGEIDRMRAQEPLRTHDGRPGNRGVVVNVASHLGLVARPDCPGYSAANAAIISMTRSDAVDYAKENIRINCVCPGVIDTPMTMDIKRNDPMLSRAPLNRKGTAQEVADVVVFLCSSKSTFIHGAAVPVDGGWTAC